MIIILSNDYKELKMINLKKYFYFFIKKIKTPIDIFEQDIDGSMEYLNNFKEPKDLVQRSYFQYKCQCFQKKRFNNFVENVLSFLLLIPFLIYLLFKGVNKKQVNNTVTNGVFILSSVGNVVPDKLKKEFTEFNEVKQDTFKYLRIIDLNFFKLFIPYLFSPYFLIKVIYKMSVYRYIIDNYSPDSIICTSEYSFTSSVLTKYCNLKEIEHVNVMHGDKLLNIRDSFFQFDRCYIWDDFYKKLFLKLRANEKQFCVDLPPSHLSMVYYDGKSFDFKYELTYYLGIEREETLLEINKKFEQGKIPLNKICIRAHPRYSKLDEIRGIFNKQISIEESNKVKLIDSLLQSKYIVSLYSTVLFQSYLMKKEVIIDDFSQKEKYMKLHKMDFIMFDKSHKLLSAIL